MRAAIDIDPVSHQVGDLRITRVTERLITTLAPGVLFPDWDRDMLEAVREPEVRRLLDGATDTLSLSVHTWVVRAPGRLMLIDTCIGNGKNRPFSMLFHRLDQPFLERLAAIGVAPDDVSHVLLTHLHVDHVGWNTRLDGGRWVPTFSNARHLFSRAEQAFYDTPAGASRRMVFDDSVAPVIRAGLAEPVDDDGGEVLDGVEFHPTPGHSIGHMAISLHSRGATALFSGDTLHHAIQLEQPQWNSVFCADPQTARASRRRVLDYAAENDALMFPAHFAGVSAGRVRRVGGAYEWQPAAGI